MAKKVLLAVDDSENAIRAVKYVSETFKDECHFTLFSVLQETNAICEMNSPSLTPLFIAQKDTFCVIENQKKILIQEAVDKAKQILLDAGIREENVTVKTVSGEQGVARSIVKEASSGYDTVVLGRRGLKGLKEFFLGSVSQKVLQSVDKVSILLVE